MVTSYHNTRKPVKGTVNWTRLTAIPVRNPTSLIVLDTEDFGEVIKS